MLSYDLKTVYFRDFPGSPVQGVLLGELIFNMPCGQNPKTLNKKKQYCNMFNKDWSTSLKNSLKKYISIMAYNLFY